MIQYDDDDKNDDEFGAACPHLRRDMLTIDRFDLFKEQHECYVKFGAVHHLVFRNADHKTSNGRKRIKHEGLHRSPPKSASTKAIGKGPIRILAISTALKS